MKTLEAVDITDFFKKEIYDTRLFIDDVMDDLWSKELNNNISNVTTTRSHKQKGSKSKSIKSRQALQFAYR